MAVDARVRVVVIAADGKGFCAGHDLKELRAHPERRLAARAVRRLQRR